MRKFADLSLFEIFQVQSRNLQRTVTTGGAGDQISPHDLIYHRFRPIIDRLVVQAVFRRLLQII